MFTGEDTIDAAEEARECAKSCWGDTALASLFSFVGECVDVVDDCSSLRAKSSTSLSDSWLLFVLEDGNETPSPLPPVFIAIVGILAATLGRSLCVRELLR